MNKKLSEMAAPTNPVTGILPEGFTLQAPVNLPILPFDPASPSVIFILSEMTVKPKFAAMAEKEGKSPEDAAPTVRAVDLVGKRLVEVLIPAVVKGVFAEDLEGDYVNKAFAIQKLGSPGQSGKGRKYYHYQVTRVALPNDFDPARYCGLDSLE